MVSIYEFAKAYEPPQIGNVADLDALPLELDIQSKEAKNQEGETYTYNFVVIKDKTYRVPASVIEEIQLVLKLRPETKSVKVSKSGTGMSTRYRVEPR